MKKLGQKWVNAIERSDSITEWVPYVNEIATHSKMKYALDKRSGQLELHRAMAEGISYPTNYGFIPRTLSEADGMELDLMAISSEPMLPLTLGRVRIIGGCAIKAEDEDEAEDKLIGALIGDPKCENMNDIGDVDGKLKKQIERFFESYKDDEAVSVKVVRWFDRLTALDKVKHGLRAYRKQ